jgi:tRNA pseudouridine-54 N-methylase
VIAMQRIFVISLSELNYEKKDLNVSFSENRLSIGLLSRIVTNAIFLSHSLREKVVIRIFIEKPVSHIVQIDSATIRYLGPELRSLASLLLKAKKKFLEAFSNNYFTNNIWFEANPRLFIRLTDNPFRDLSAKANTPIPLVSVALDSNHKKPEDVKSVTLKEFEHLIKTLSENKDAFILYLPFISEHLSKIPLNSQEFIITSIAISQKIDLARLTNIVNIILDENIKKT